MRELIPLPRERDYEVAVQRTSEMFQLEGGPLEAIRNRQRLTSTHYSVYTENLNAGVVSLNLEPVDANNIPIDPIMRVTHAFKHGMLAGHKVINLAHDGIFSPNGATDYISWYVLSMQNRGADSQDVKKGLLELGADGLINAGSKATQNIERIAEGVSIDTDLSRLYTLGCGAIIRSGYCLLNMNNIKYMSVLDETEQLAYDRSRYIAEDAAE